MSDLEPRAANGQMVALAGGRVTPRPHLLAHVDASARTALRAGFGSST